MAIELVVLVISVALARANSGVPAVAFVYNVPYVPASPITYIKYSLNDKNESKIHADPVVLAVYDFHKTFLDKLRVKPPYHYSYGFECFNSKKGLSLSQYEARYGDMAVGNHVHRGPEGGRTTVEYTVDSSAGFYGVVHRDSQGQPSDLGYARLAGPLAFASHPSLPTPRGTPLADPGTNPLVISAVYSHDFFVNYLSLEAPFRYSFGYELKDSESGITRSQYETYYGEEGEGTFTQIEADGTKNGIDYSIRPQGFAFVTSSRTKVEDAIPLVHATPLGYTNLHLQLEPVVF